MGIRESDGTNTGLSGPAEVFAENIDAHLVLHVVDLDPGLLKPGFVASHGSPVQPQLLLVKSLGVMTVPEEQGILDQRSARDTPVQARMGFEELMRKDQEQAGFGHR